MTEAKIRPFLKWAGGKYQLLPHLLSHLKDGHCLLEPFVGAGAVFLNSDFRRYKLNDTNPDLIHVYQILQNEGQGFIDDAKSFFNKHTNNAQYYYAAREKFNSLPRNEEKASLFIYLNRHGYNGLCRYNASGKYNVPFGSYKNPLLPEESMQAFYEKLAYTTLSCQHFSKVMQRVGKRTVVYCDPPYVPLSKTAHFTRYGGVAFETGDQNQLAESAKRLHQAGVKVIVSNHDTPYTRRLYENADITSIKVARTISCNTLRRLPVRELIAVYSGQ